MRDDNVMNEFIRTEVINALAMGLQENAPQHKQYYMEKALRYILGEAEFSRAKRDLGWDSGIPS